MSEFGVIDGLSNAITLTNIGYALLGCLLGMLVGILPGLGPASAMAILLPVSVYLPPISAVVIMAGVYYGAMYGGSTTAILLNIPGEVASVVTTIDGFQMTRQGRGGEALAIAAIGSFIAGILGTLAIAWLGPLLAQIALQFGPPEYFGIIVFSLIALISFSGSSLLLGITMGVFGIWLATIGVDQMTGTQRLTFGTIQLMNGVDIIPLAVGLFGIGEVMFNARQRTARVFMGKLPSWYKSLPRGLELRRGLYASLRGSAVGGLGGLLPGMVPAITSYLAYDLEKKVSRHRTDLGKGAIEGVAAPEAANNATAMTGFIPLLSLGIPTSATLAIVLSTLVLNGVQPGPNMFTRHAELAYTVIASMLTSNAMLLVLSLPLIGLWARISIVPYSILGPLVLAICVVGAYAPRNSMFDVYVAIAFGAFGYMMRYLEWPLSPVIFGFLMGQLLEESLRQSLGMSGGGIEIFFIRPIPAGCIAAAAIVMAAIIYVRWKSQKASQLIAGSVNEI